MSHLFPFFGTAGFLPILDMNNMKLTLGCHDYAGEDFYRISIALYAFRAHVVW